MRPVRILLLIVLFSAQSFGAIAKVQHKACRSDVNNTSYTCTTDSSVTNGNLLIVIEGAAATTIGNVATLDAPTAPCVSGGFTAIVAQVNNPDRDIYMRAWYGYIDTGGSSCTVTTTNTHGGTWVAWGVVLYELSGTAASSPVDASCTRSTAGSATNSPTCSAAMTITGTDYAIGAIFNSSAFSATGTTATSPLTLDTGYGGGSTCNFSTAYGCPGAAGSGAVSASFTPGFGLPENKYWSLLAFAIKPSGGAPSATKPSLGWTF